MKFISLILSLGVTTVFALNNPIACLGAIESAVSNFRFLHEASTCSGNLSVHSLWAAANVYCTPEEIAAGSASLRPLCYGDELIHYSEIQPDLTNEYVHSLPVVNFEDIQQKKVWHTAVLLSPELYAIGLQSEAVNLVEVAIKTHYGWALFGFWGGIIVIGMINNVFSSIFHSRLARRVVDIEGERSVAQGGWFHTIHHWARAKLIIPATLGSYHQRLFGTVTIPTRPETIVVCCYWALNIILSTLSYETTWPNTGFPVPYQIWAYVAHRVITLAAFNLPWLWLFAGRNNIFLWLTGWSYSTFSIFHRNIARIVFVEAVVHATNWTVIGHFDGLYFVVWGKPFWQMGVVALFSFGMLMLLSFSPVRKNFYEFFLLAHITFAILAIAGLFYHLSVWNGKYNGQLWSVIAIWGFDRAVRLFRLLYYNLRLKFSTDMVDSPATVIYSQEADVIQLEVTTQRKTAAPPPGAHYFLYQPLRWKGWESHPFTLAMWSSANSYSFGEKTAVESTENRLGTEIDQQLDEKSPYSVQQGSGTPSTITLSDETEKAWQRRKLIFWIRPCSGWTNSLRDACLAQSDTPLRTKILIEGPYGHTVPIHTYDNVLYIIGGTGISVATSYLADHKYRSAANPSKTRTRRITLLWTVKQAQHIRDTMQSPVELLFKRDDVRTVFYASQQNGIPSEEKDPGIQSGRPDIQGEIIRYVEEASCTERTAIVTCGPAAMADAVRAAMKTVVNNGRRGVDYFEEAYGW